MSRAFRLSLFFAAAVSVIATSTAVAAAAMPVTEAATSVARPLPGCSAVLSAAVAAADLEVVAGGARNTSSSSGSNSSSSSSSTASAPYSNTLLPNGDFLLETAWQTWECMSGVRARGFLTLRPFPASSSSPGATAEAAAEGRRRDGGGDGDDDLFCSTVDAGIEIDDRAFEADKLPSVAQVDACSPRFCVFGNKEAAEPEQQQRCSNPSLLRYLDVPAADSPFSPFRTVQLDYEPLGHAPRGVYSDPHFDFHFYYTPREEVEAIERGECGGGFLSPASWKKALAPVPLKCFPTGAWSKVGLAVNSMGDHIVNLLSPEFNRLPRGFGQTLLFVRRSFCFCLFFRVFLCAPLPRSILFSFSFENEIKT